MKNLLNKFFFILSIALSLYACGGGGGSEPIVFGESDPPPEAVCDSIDEGNQISSNPPCIQFEPTPQNESVIMDFALTNGMETSQTLTLRIYGSSGGFRFMKKHEDGSKEFSAYLPDDIVLAPLASQDYEIVFDAALAGSQSATIEVTSRESSGTLQIPVQASVTGPADMKVITSGYFCTDKNAPELELLDFMRTASGRKKTRSFKICNTGGESIQLNEIRLSENTSGAVSDAMAEDIFSDSILPSGDEISGGLGETYEPETNEEFTEPTLIPFDVNQHYYDPVSAFKVKAVNYDGTTLDPKGLVIASGSYVRLDVEYAPTLNADAAEDGAGQEGDFFLYDTPASYAADMEINTSIGSATVDLVGASAGKEPYLEVTYTKDPDDPCLQDKNIACGYTLDLDSLSPAIYFGTAKIYEDWVTDDSTPVYLKFQNVGSGTSPLKIWANTLVGYFTFGENSPESFPIDLGNDKFTNNSTNPFVLKYAPTPATGVADDTYDFGQITIYHTGGNGPQRGIFLVGEQETAKAVIVKQQYSKIKNTELLGVASYNKKFCIYQENGDWKPLTFEIQNYTSHALKTSVSWTGVTGGSLTISPSNSISTPGVSESGTEPEVSSFQLNFTPTNEDVIEIEGYLEITYEYNDLADNPEGYDLRNESTIHFTVEVSYTGECEGGTGQPISGTATILIDRITMNMISGTIPEPTRTHTAFKFQLPIDLDPENGTARLHALEYDPSNEGSPVHLFRSYAHQITGVNLACAPRPTNPYKLEFEPGSYDGPFQCDYVDPDGIITIPDGSVMCLNSNGAQDYVADEATNYKVFYHEFIKFDESCNVEFKGRVATFYLKPGEEISDAFARLKSEVGTGGSESEYDAARGAYQFDSYIEFMGSGYNCNGQNYAAGFKLENDPDAIKACWNAFGEEDTPVFSRITGWVDECAYFNFIVDEGKVPTSVDPTTWEGFGEYEPDPEDETKWDITLRNVHIQAFSLYANGFFTNAAKVLYSDMYVTLTTKAVGSDPSDVLDLVAVKSQSDFPEEKVRLNAYSDTTQSYWSEDPLNSKFTAGGVDDKDVCEDVPAMSHCRGNYMLDGGTLMHAGEHFDFGEGNGRGMLVGLGSFHGEGELAPFFAREDEGTGRGSALYFTLHGCLKDGSEELTDDAGCYDPRIDSQDEDEDNEPIAGLIDDYIDHGILTEADRTDDGDPTNGVSKALVNYIIYDDDRDRFTDYYNVDYYYFQNPGYYGPDDDPNCGGYGH